MLRITAAIALLVCLITTDAEARRYRHRGRLPWCGIYMTQYTGIHKRNLWLAAEWAKEGSNAGGPGVGVIVVWRHHVGIITGQDSNGRWLIHSGNDGNAVRTRARSLAGVIAYRKV